MTRDDSFSIGFYLDKNPRHVRVGEGRRHQTHVSLIGTAQELHGPSGQCTCCHGRATGKASPLAAVNAAAPVDEWAVFVAAVRQVAVDGLVHQCDMRPLLRGRVAPKHVGQMYRRARAEGLLRDTGDREPSNDVAGRNADKLDRIYALGAAA